MRFRVLALAVLAVGFCALLSLKTRGELSIVEEQEDNPNLPNADDEIERKYDRFPDGGNTHGDWIGQGYDWSGVGKQVSGSANPYRWGTMISSRFCVSALHTTVPEFDNLRFYYGVDPNDEEERVDRTFVTGGLKAVIPDPDDIFDLAIAELQTPVADDMAVYPILSFQNPNFYPYAQQLLFFGQGAIPDGTPPEYGTDGRDNLSSNDPRSQKVGTNYIVLPYDSTNRWLEYRFLEQAGPSTCMMRRFSSGAPAFASISTQFGNRPVLVSTHSRGFLPQDEEKNDIWSEPAPLLSTGLENHIAGYTEELKTLMFDIQEDEDIEDHLKEVPTFVTGTVVNETIIFFWADFNGDFAQTTADLDLILRDVHARNFGPRGYNWRLDLNDDRVIDDADADWVVENYFGTRRGDINWDHDVDDDDYDILLNNFGTGSTWAGGDLNGDGEVDLYDFAIFDANYPWGN